MRYLWLPCLALLIGCDANTRPGPGSPDGLAAATPSGPRAGEEIELKGGGAYLFRDRQKIGDYARLLKADRDASWKYLNALDGSLEDFHTSDGRPKSPADTIRMFGGTKLLVLETLPDNVLKVQVKSATTWQTDARGDLSKGLNTNYLDEVGYVIPGLISE